MNNDRFKFRCWVTGTTYDYDTDSDIEFGYYIYSDTISDGQIIAAIDEVKKACGLTDEQQIESYLDTLDMVDEYEQVWLSGELEQCTGLRDKNGKLVYSGDILDDGGCRFVVKWSDQQCGFYGYTNIGMRWLSLNSVLLENFVIVGNINENAELLGVKYEQ